MVKKEGRRKKEEGGRKKALQHFDYASGYKFYYYCV